MFWGVALKMVRYQKGALISPDQPGRCPETIFFSGNADDPADILAMLRHGTKLNGVQWTPQVLEGWLMKECWPMGYSHYPSYKLEELRTRFNHAVQLVQQATTSSRDHHRRIPSHDPRYYSH